MKQDIVIPYVDDVFEFLGQCIDRPADQIRIITMFLTAFVVCYFYRYIDSPKSRYAYSIIMGFLIQFCMFREGWVHIFIVMIVTFFMLRVLDRETQAEYVFAFNIAYLSVLHLYNILTDFGGWTLDVTTFMMPFVCRLSSLGYCYRDGMDENKGKLSKEQEERKLERLPDFHEILCYSVFPGGNVWGPFFEFSHLKDFIHKKGKYFSIPDTTMVAISKLASGLMFMSLSIIIPMFYDTYHCGEPAFKEYSFLYKNFFYYIAMAGSRYKYYSAWYLSDCSVYMSGLSYNGRDKNGEHKFDRIVSIRGYLIEIGTNPREWIDHWNHQIAEWLRFYVFLRFKSVYPKSNFTATLFTMMVSAFWHGFYPVYYAFFFFSTLVAESTKDIYRARHLFSWMPPTITPILLHILTLQGLNFLGISFVLLTFDKAHNFYSSVYYDVPIIWFIIIVLFRFTPLRKFAKKGAKSKDETKDKLKKTQ